MKAIRLRSPGGLDNLQSVDMEAPQDPAAGEIRVRLHASSLNYHDYGVASRPGWQADGRIPMSDGAGVVEAVGAGVTAFAVGDAVVSCFFPTWADGPATIADFATVPGDGVDGFAREAVTLPATAFTRAPRGFSHAEAATLTTAGLTAWRALVVDGGLKAGDTVLVLGTGGVSIFALQFAKAMGATVVATSSSDEKLERARALGADHTINYRREPDWGRRVWDWTGGRGVDHVVEVGGPGTLPQSIAAVRVGGHIALIGVLTRLCRRRAHGTLHAQAGPACRVSSWAAAASRSTWSGPSRPSASSPSSTAASRSTVWPEAFRHQESGSHFGKICLTF